ncbi:MAG: RHS repeat-associated core domain-containing protein [Anaerolineae bacterium]
MGGAGRLTDTGGLMYYGARYYLPELRRFISADTIVPGGANPLAYNRYAYVYNSPVKYTDPTGHAPFCIDDCVDGEYIYHTHSPTAEPRRQFGGDGGPTDWCIDDLLCGTFDETVQETYLEAYFGYLETDYGINAEFMEYSETGEYYGEINFQDRILAYQALESVVLSFANNLASIGVADNPRNAFMSTFGSKRVQFLPGDGRKTDKGYSICLNTRTSNCFFGEYKGDTIEIVAYYFANMFTANGVAQTGTALTAHELGHALDGPPYYSDYLTQNPLFIDGQRATQNYLFSQGYFGVQSRSSGQPWEYTADVVASWGMGQIYGGYRLQYHVNDYMRNKLGVNP